jgi:hypothetical protein
MKDMKKRLTIIVASILVIALTCFIYVLGGTKNSEKLMWEYLKAKGYAAEQIENIDVKHSFLNILLSYNEWIIRVQYVDEPEAIYLYTIKDGQIKDAGISGSVDKEDLKHIN